MIKTAKVMEVGEGKKYNPTPKICIYYHRIKMENGDEGTFTTNVNPQVKFQVGEEYKYTYEQKKDKDGKDVTDKYGKPEMIIDKWKEPFQQGKSKIMTKPESERSIAASVALKCARRYLLNKKDITPEIIKKLADRFYLYLIDGNIIYIEPVEKFEHPSVQLAIQKQTALEESCKYYANAIVTADIILSVSKDYNEFINFKSNM